MMFERGEKELLRRAFYYTECINCIEEGSLNAARFLVTRGEKVHHDLISELFRVASQKGYFEIVQLLVARGAEIRSLDDFALCWAAYGGFLNVVQLLIQEGADIHARLDGPLRCAAQQGHVFVAQLLINTGAYVQACNNDALLRAAENGHCAMVSLLLEFGAEIESLLTTKTVLCVAAEGGFVDIVQLLVGKGANIHARNDYALIWAAGNGHFSVVQYLLSVAYFQQEAITIAIVLARRRSYTSIVMLLKPYLMSQ